MTGWKFNDFHQKLPVNEDGVAEHRALDFRSAFRLAREIVSVALAAGCAVQPK
jgi:hypothetical protein